MRRLLPLLGPIAVVAVMWACAEKSFIAAGGECFQAIDCQDGLVCVPEQGSTRRICSNDLNGISPSAGYDAGMMDGGVISYNDAYPDNYTPPPDNYTPPPDTGSGTDTGGGGTDSGGGTD